jgi:hypothetical protein
MATYSTLLNDINSFLNRQDMTNVGPTLIRLVEADMNRRLRDPRMERRSRAVFDERFEELPQDFIEIRTLTVDGYLVHPAGDALNDTVRFHRPTYGRPTHFRIAGTQIDLWPEPTTSDTYEAEVLYYARLPALSDDTPSNWVLNDHYDLYLYGALLHAAPFLVEDERIAVWKSFYEAGMQSLSAMSDRMLGTAGAGNLRVQYGRVHTRRA